MIAEVTIREALNLEPIPTEAEMMATIKAAKFRGSEPTPAGSLFEACVEAVAISKADGRDGFTDENCAIITQAVIQTIIDRTPAAHGGRADAHPGGWVVRRLFAALVAVLVCDEVTGNGALCLLVFVAVIAAIGSARKADT